MATKTVASLGQGKFYAERWCAARLYTDLPLREAGALLIDATLIQSAPPLPGLPPTREQHQQAWRLAEATAAATARVKEALEPSKPSATKPNPEDARNVDEGWTWAPQS